MKTTIPAALLALLMIALMLTGAGCIRLTHPASDTPSTTGNTPAATGSEQSATGSMPSAAGQAQTPATTSQPAPPAAPTILFFKAMPEAISTGQAVTLSWSTRDATSVTLSGVGDVPPTGNRIVTPVNSREYTLTAANSAGSTSLAVSIDVTSYISDKPDLTIIDFRVEGKKACYKIKNIGQTAVIPESYTNPNARPSLTYLYVDGTYRDTSRVEVLAPGEERELCFPNYEWTHGSTRTYSLPIRICADGQNQIGEYDKNNNCLVLDW